MNMPARSFEFPRLPEALVPSAKKPAPARPVQRPHSPLAQESAMKVRTQCPACLGASLSVLYEEPYRGAGLQAYLTRHYEGHATDAADAGTYALARCEGCGLVFQQQVPGDALLGEIYNGWVPGTDLEREHRDYSLDEYRYLAEQVQFIIQHFGLPPGELDILDFGFGWAHWSRMAMAYGCNVWGVELSEERAQHGKSVGLRVVGLADLPARRFRFINTEQVFEHLTEPRAVLAQLRDALSCDGVIKISVPDAAASLKKIGQAGDFGALSAQQQMPIAPLEHINSFSHDSLIAFGKEFGLKPLHPSFYRLYNSASGLLQLKNLARALARPVYRHIFPRSTFVYFVRA
ncbi:class I SAM-dependent methyltransferase [Polaromonas sp. YR568]|uniref:class I SAM-dependent methyltransferase n=1 Tax=Polaromonas sp. YR568 TaxID=1855301 RepID=UPI00398C0487